MSIKNWPETERPREKLLSQGPGTLNDSELLAIFLRTGCAGKSAVDLARDLLTEFGGLRPLLEADQTAFCSAHGMGKAKFAQLQAVLEMAKRHLLSDISRPDSFNESAQVKRYLTAHMRHKQSEVFAVLFLDNQNRLIKMEELFSGTIDSANVYPREVVKRVLALNAAAVMFAHNHPSGISTPSQADIDITRQLTKALNLIDVRVVDHFIVGEGRVTSFKESGLL